MTFTDDLKIPGAEENNDANGRERMVVPRRLPPTPEIVPGSKDDQNPEPLNALNELLSIDPKSNHGVPTTMVDMSPRYDAPWEVKALDDELNDRLLEEASEVKKNTRTGQTFKELNTAKFARLVIYHCTISPKLSDPRLFKKYGLREHQHERLIRTILPLPGYVERVSSKIMEISGFAEQLVTVAKNSSSEED